MNSTHDRTSGPGVWDPSASGTGVAEASEADGLRNRLGELPGTEVTKINGTSYLF
jgi:hypothetical protein